MLKPNTARLMATPGQIAIQGALYMYERPEPLSISHHEGYGGGTPKPRKLKAASVRITVPRLMVAMMMIGAMMFGRMYRRMMRRWWAPTARAASTNCCSLAAMAALRMMRELLEAERTPS